MHKPSGQFFWTFYYLPPKMDNLITLPLDVHVNFA